MLPQPDAERIQNPFQVPRLSGMFQSGAVVQMAAFRGVQFPFLAENPAVSGENVLTV